jgi:signal transduction histidine kinase
VLGNLIGNARKYAGPTASITVSARLDGAMAVVSVSDDGPGIAEEHREHLFEHFYRVPGVVIEGTGVGLAIVERYVGLLGGTVWCESEVDVGTTFSFTLPLAEPGAHP